MTLLEFFSQFKKSKPDVRDQAYIEGFSSGFEYGLSMAGFVDSKVKEKIKQEAIQESLDRFYANKKIKDDKRILKFVTGTFLKMNFKRIGL